MTVNSGVNKISDTNSFLVNGLVIQYLDPANPKEMDGFLVGYIMEDSS